MFADGQATIVGAQAGVPVPLRPALSHPRRDDSAVGSHTPCLKSKRIVPLCLLSML
jgi:hypothetical protein